MRQIIPQQFRRFLGEERGAALVEMTLITPLMLALAAGVFEFSNIMHTKLLIETGLRDGTRYIARCYRSEPPTACETSGIDVAVMGGTATARVINWTAGQVSVGYETTPISVDVDGLQNYRSNTSEVRVVAMSTDYAYTGTGLWAYLGFGALTLSMMHEERVLGW